MEQKSILIIIGGVLIGIFGLMLFQYGQQTRDEKINTSISDVINSAGDGIKEFKEEVKDEIDDNTDSKP